MSQEACCKIEANRTSSSNDGPVPAESCSVRTREDEDKKTANESSERKKTILFVPLDCIGHVNSLISIADSYKHLGHRTVFLFYDPMDGGLKEKGHEVYDCTEEGLIESRPTAASERKWDMIVNEMGKLWRSTLMDNFIQTTRVGLGSMMRDIMRHEERVSRKLQLIKPDLIIIDHYFIQPALIKYNKPWARVYSASPLALHPRRHKLPPATLGLPTDWLSANCATTKASPKMRLIYESYARQVDEVRGELWEEFNEYLVGEHKLDPLPDDPASYIYNSPYLNVYMYPEELDYQSTHGLPVPRGWQRCDSILRLNTPSNSSKSSAAAAAEEFELPRELADKPGKLIFLSMGSLASGDVELMKRLVSCLAKASHRFIVSRGPNWQKYELAPNMWGEKFVKQLAILPKIDLIITHGGNNTITECFYYGVPGFIVCPVFSDQFDNAQRIEECALGRRVDPFHFEDSQLLDAIEDVLGRQEADIKPRMLAISERMQRDENKFRGIRLFQELLERI